MLKVNLNFSRICVITIVILIFFNVLLVTYSYSQENVLISIGTASVTGAYYPIGGGMAELINNNLPGVIANAEATAGSIENARLVAKDDLQIAMANVYAIISAINGEEPFNEKIDNLLGVATNHGSQTAIIVRENSPIKSIDDLRGKKVSIGAPGSTNYVTILAIFEAYGITIDDFVPQHQTFAESVTAFKEGRIDATCIQGGSPMAAVTDLTSSLKCRLLSIGEEYVEKMQEKGPWYNSVIIPSGTYPHIDEDILSVNVWNIIFTNSNMSEELLYKILDLWYQPKSLEYLRNVHPAAAEMTIEDGPNVSIPLHPGAEKFWRDKGVLK